MPAPFIVALVLAISCRAANDNALCSRIAEIREVPFKKEHIQDPVYNEIISHGNRVIPCLIAKITDDELMPDPRKAPPYPGFKVGDMAVFLLTAITEVEINEVLKSEIGEGWDRKGIYAYFEYVRNDKNRVIVQNRWKEWIKHQPVS